MNTRIKPEVQVDIRQAGIELAIFYAQFDEAKEALESQGYRIISLEENARLRMQQGRDSYISGNGNWTREGVLYIPKKGAFLTKNSPIMQNPVEATQSHREGKDYFLADEQVEQALIDSVKLSQEVIPTNRFSENEITNFAFGEVAEQYGQFLRETGIKQMPVWLANLQEKAFARQMWFWAIDGGSLLDCGNWDLRGLSIDGRLRGVKKLNKSKLNTN